jgi:hypothetical protein
LTARRAWAVFALAACLAATLFAGAVGPAAARSTVVKFERSGGFAGFDDHLTVFSDRRYVARSRDGAARRLRLSVKGMRALRHDLDAAHLDRPLPAPGPSGCADCFEYTITYHGHRVSLSEDKVPDRMRAAIARLSRIVR